MSGISSYGCCSNSANLHPVRPPVPDVNSEDDIPPAPAVKTSNSHKAAKIGQLDDNPSQHHHKEAPAQERSTGDSDGSVDSGEDDAEDKEGDSEDGGEPNNELEVRTKLDNSS